MTSSGSAQPGEFGLQPPGVVRLGETGDPVRGGGEQNPVPGLAGADCQADGQVGFAGSCRRASRRAPRKMSRMDRSIATTAES
jgi:hypothetical protein